MTDFDDHSKGSDPATDAADDTPSTQRLPTIQSQSPPVPEWSSYGQPRFDQPSQPPPPSSFGPQPEDGSPPPYGAPGYDPSDSPLPSSVTESVASEPSDSSPSGAGMAGLLGVVGLTAAGVGLFGLPLQRSGRTEIVFADLRTAAALGRRSVGGSPTLESPLGGSLATFWWRYGAFITVAVVALLLALMIATAGTRRIGGALLFLGAGGATALAIFAGTQTNGYGRALTNVQFQKVEWRHWQVGAWVAVAGLALAAFGGLVALLSGLGSDED